MVSGRRQAMDSAFIKANASMETLLEKEVLEDVDAYADELAGNSEQARQSVLGKTLRPNP
jgi:hypothetical protein